MRFAGSASWRFAEGVDHAPLVALFVRDALGLEVPDEVTTPPHLDGEVPDMSTVLNPGRRAAAGAAWSSWWQAVVADDMRRHQGPPASADQRLWRQEIAAAHRSAFDPPDFASLADRPVLAAAVRLTMDDALRWANMQRRNLLMPLQGRPDQFDYDMVRAAAEQTIRRHHVSPDAVRACAVVLPVEGVWWARFTPGAVLCAVHAARDPKIAQRVLTEAFESSIPR